MRKIFELVRSTRAATAIEYGLIVALIFIAAMGAIVGLGTETTEMWTGVSSAANEAMAGQ